MTSSAGRRSCQHTWSQEVLASLTRANPMHKATLTISQPRSRVRRRISLRANFAKAGRQRVRLGRHANTINSDPEPENDNGNQTVPYASRRGQTGGCRTCAHRSESAHCQVYASRRRPACASDLCLLDMRLPKRGGEDILKLLRSTEHYAQTAVIIMSGINAPYVEEAAAKHAALVFFQKPSTADEYFRLGPFRAEPSSEEARSNVNSRGVRSISGFAAGTERPNSC